MEDAKVITEPLVTLDILEYYDSQIKRWVLNRVNQGVAKTSILFFSNKNDFPVIGEMDTLYVTKDNLYLWDQNNSDYMAISSSGEDSLIWESF